MSLPADARRRWGLASGGAIEVIDIGSALVLMPELDSLRSELALALDDGRYAKAVAAIDDPELATE